MSSIAREQDDRPFPDEPPYRPPSEADSVLLRVTRGCAWNRCAFCGMYKRLRFEARPVADVLADLHTLAALYPGGRSIFLADSDSLVHARLSEILPHVRTMFPQAERITSYTRLRTLDRLSPEKLQRLRENGLTRIHAGLESGADEILERMNKGVTAEQAIAGGCKAVAAGFDLCFYVLCGLGGENSWELHARETARVVSAVRPRVVRLRSLALLSGTPLHDRWRAGEFNPAEPRTRLREIRLLIEMLAADSLMSQTRIDIRSDHFSNYVWADGRLIFAGVFGSLPADRESMLAAIDDAAAQADVARKVTDPNELALRGRIAGV